MLELAQGETGAKESWCWPLGPRAAGQPLAAGLLCGPSSWAAP